MAIRAATIAAAAVLRPMGSSMTADGLIPTCANCARSSASWRALQMIIGAARASPAWFMSLRAVCWIRVRSSTSP